MPTQKALVLPEERGAFVVQDIEIPKPGPGELLIQVISTGLNPADWLIQAYGIEFIQNYPIVLGWDSAGYVKEVGEGVTQFVVGDKVLHEGFFTDHGAAYQQYSIVPAEIAAKIPENLTFDQAATLPLAVATAVFGLYDKKAKYPQRCGAGLVPIWEEGGRGRYAGQPILVIGGASAVGQQAIQFARISGFSPILTTASKHNEALLKSLGATHVIDRHLPLETAVQSITPEPIRIVFNAVSSAGSQSTAYGLVAPGGQYIIVTPLQLDSAAVTADKEVVFMFGSPFPAPQRPLGAALYKHLTALLQNGEIKPNNVEIVPGGLAGIPAGLDKLRSGVVSATKLIAHPQE